MSKLARLPQKGVTSPVATEHTPTIRNHAGVPAYLRDAKSELFLLAVSNFVSEGTFYESATKRDSRYVELIRAVAAESPEWVSDMLIWLRREANMRSASIVGAVEAGIAMGETPMRRTLLAAVMQRPDEPAEVLGYWLSKYGKPLPKWIKKAIGDGAVKLYDERSALKYDTVNSTIRFGDVLELSQIGRGKFNPILAKWLLDRRRKREWTSSEGLPTIQAREQVVAQLATDRSSVTSDDLSTAGMTWEALGGTGKMGKAEWEAMIPSMGYMALLRNLRNFDETGVSDEVARTVIAKLTTPSEVKRSRQLPMRFLSAYKAAPSDRWKHGLSEALDISLDNIPELDGESIVLIDTSGSMGTAFSERGALQFWEQAALFGIAFAKRNKARVFSFSSSTIEFYPRKGASVLSDLAEFSRTHFQGGGTDTPGAIRTGLAAVPNARRVIILTDEQVTTRYSLASGTPVERVLEGFEGQLYVANLAGYRGGMAENGVPNRHAFTGLNDSLFTTMATIESARDGKWPWEK